MAASPAKDDVELVEEVQLCYFRNPLCFPLIFGEG
jgi:hypothetical protein